jgi:hypothetical protein
MEWIERLRDRIVDPRRIAPESRSLLVVGLAHSRGAVELPGGGRIARYAAGRDYHNVMGRMLRKLGRRLREAGIGRPGKRIVDAGPLMERSHAAEAGLGFESKAANLLHPSFGPWFFLAELLLDEELEPTTAPAPGTCGTCTACLDACRPGAIVAPGESMPAPASATRPSRTGARSPRTCGRRSASGRSAATCARGLSVGLEVRGLRRSLRDARGGVEPRSRRMGRPQGCPRAPARGFGDAPAGTGGPGRNAVLVLGARPTDEGRRALLRALTFDSSAMVRETAAWSLARSHGRDAGRARHSTPPHRAKSNRCPPLDPRLRAPPALTRTCVQSDRRRSPTSDRMDVQSFPSGRPRPPTQLLFDNRMRSPCGKFPADRRERTAAGRPAGPRHPRAEP